MVKKVTSHNYENVLVKLKNDVLTSHRRAAQEVNTRMISLYHRIGTLIRIEKKKLGWGAKVIKRLSADLRHAFPNMRGFSTRNLNMMIKFAGLYPNINKNSPVLQMPWGHVSRLIQMVKSSKTREFYIKNTIQYGWSRRLMVHHIESKLHEREGLATSNFENQLKVPQSSLAKQALKDPYFFDFLHVGKEANERDIEQGLIKQMEKFLLELGSGFAFVGRQYQLTVGETDFYIDLLFYHLELRCFVVVEIKTGKFKPEYAGKINFYLSAVDQQIKHESDQPSIGLILCKSKDSIVAEYALKNLSTPVGISEYNLTKSLPHKLEDRLPSVDELEGELDEETYRGDQ